MRAGVRLGVDVGSVRIGVAACDPAGLLATPVETVSRGPGDLDRLAELATTRQAVAMVVGLPRSLSGREGPAAATTREFATALAARVSPLPVRLVDERLSTVSATRSMRAAGTTTRRGRDRVDAAAAAIILQTALDFERTGGRPAGEIIEVVP